ncbi:MAG: hypothetical protein IJ961_00295 [Bacteroidales bacterium]|nr:hypothetical protein [Bacteroidales bacterium]
MKKISSIIIMFGCMLFLSQPMNAQEEGATTASLNGHEWVDLGLPSGIKWATCNVGASTPEQYGTYFAWGELLPKDEYKSDNYLANDISLDDISGNAEYDVAAARWGGDWRMPAKTELQELRDNCTWTWTELNNVKGYILTGPNGNNIFLPASGVRYSGSFTDGTCGYTCYWSSTLSSTSVSYHLYFNESSHDVINNSPSYCYYGHTIRPVRDAETETKVPFTTISAEYFTDISVILKIYASSPGVDVIERGFYWGTNPELGATDNNVVLDKTTGYITKALVDLEPNTTYYLKAYATNSVGTSYSEVVSFTTLAESEYNDYVDLGLPSGLKWAAYNIGATTATEYGDYYAWGEVLTKETYTTANSETYGESMSDIAGTEYDVATVNWGGDWRMPSNAEIQELIDNCNWEWTTQGGKQGYKVTGLNGNHIFLPAAGYHSESSLPHAGSIGYYWSSAPYGSTRAYYIQFGSDSHIVTDYNRHRGFTVRPVRE